MDINAYLDGAETMLNGQVCDNCKHWSRVGVKLETRTETPILPKPSFS